MFLSKIFVRVCACVSLCKLGFLDFKSNQRNQKIQRQREQKKLNFKFKNLYQKNKKTFFINILFCTGAEQYKPVAPNTSLLIDVFDIFFSLRKFLCDDI